MILKAIELATMQKIIIKKALKIKALALQCVDP
jgi:hypothetical protein